MTDRTVILNELRSGSTPEELAKKLDMRKQTIKAMLEFLVHQGTVKKIDCSSTCEGCIMGKSCAGLGEGREKLYIVEDEIG